MTLRDRLAAVLGPGNDDATAYAQADAVLGVLADEHPGARTALMSAALGVFDVVSPRVLGEVRTGATRGARVTVSPIRLAELLRAVDAQQPGLVDRYVEVHRRAHI